MLGESNMVHLDDAADIRANICLFHSDTWKKQPHIFCISLTILLSAVIFLASNIKPSHWVNTLLCFPTGMFYYLKGKSIVEMLNATKIPSLIYAFLFIASAYFTHHANTNQFTYTQILVASFLLLGWLCLSEALSGEYLLAFSFSWVAVDSLPFICFTYSLCES